MTTTLDASYRFVLAEDAPFVRNLAALWATQPQLAALLEQEQVPTHASFEKARDGNWTCAVKLPDGHTAQLHSRYEPAAEAAKQIAALATDGCVAFYLLGLGLGYTLEALRQQASDEALIFIFEPDLALLRAVLEKRDLSESIACGRVWFFHQADKTELFNRLMPQAAMLSMGFIAVEHAPSLRLHGEFFSQARRLIDEFVSYARTSLNTLVLNGQRTAENITLNLGWYRAAGSVERLRDRYRGRPAIVVSAGPSLRKNRHLLKQADGKAVLVAVQTTLKPLLEMGIEPQFVTALDYHDICTRFYENLPSRLHTELVAEPKASNKIFGLWPGPLSILGNQYADQLLAELPADKARLRSGATVAHLAYYLAEHLGCDPIIFVGQDLGFSDGLCYAPGTSYERVWGPELSRFCTLEMKQWEQVARDRAILRRVPDQQGRPMYTEERLYTYLQQFERDFLSTERTIVDATEGGAAKRGSRVMTLAAALEEYCQEDLPVAVKEPAALNWSALGDCQKSLLARAGEARQIEQVALETLPLLEELAANIEDQGRVNRLLGRIDALRAQMNQLNGCYELILQLTQQSELQRFQRDRKLEAEKVRGVHRQRRQVQRDIENVRAMAEAAAVFERLMRRVAGELALQSEQHA